MSILTALGALAQEAPQVPVLSAPGAATAKTPGWRASVPAREGMTYRWTLSSGTFSGPGGAAGVTVEGTNTITFSAGGVGTLRLTCVEVNGAGVQSAPGTASVLVVAPPARPSINTTGPVTEDSAGLSAWVAARSGMRYEWTLANGTLTSAAAGVTAGGRNTLTYRAGAPGTLTLGCVEVNAAGTRSEAASRSLSVAPLPLTPAVSAAGAVGSGATGQKASVAARPGMRYAWTVRGGTLVTASTGATSGGRNSITFSAGTSGSVDLTCVETNAAGASSAPGTARVAILPAAEAPVSPVITSKSPVTEGEPGRTASVPARAGFSYRWSLSNGTLDADPAGTTVGGKNTITFTPGAAGSATLGCVETSAAGHAGLPGTRTLSVLAAPVAPDIHLSAAGPVLAGTSGLGASVTARAGMTYSWQATGGALESASGGVTSGGLNTVNFAAGAPGTLALACTERNAAGSTSAPGTATLEVVVPEPRPPALAAPGPVYSGERASASVVARPFMSYRWTLSGLSGEVALVSPGGAAGQSYGGLNAITYEPRAEGPLTLGCTEVAPDGRESEAASATVEVLPPRPPRGPVLYPADRTHSPLTEDGVARLRAVAAAGVDLVPGVFMKVGDSITASTHFLGCFDGDITGTSPAWHTNIRLGGRTDLADAILFFRSTRVGSASPFGRTSLAARVGEGAGWALAGSPSPLTRELQATRAPLALVMYGTNDMGLGGTSSYPLEEKLAPYERNMRQLVDTLLAQGVVPVLSTVPPRLDEAGYRHVWPAFNGVVRALAQGRGVPLVDLERQLLALPAPHGIDSDGVHPTVQDYNTACHLDAVGLGYGYNVRNLATLEALARLRRVLYLGEPAPDADAPRLGGSGTAADPLRIEGLPFVDLRDTRTAGQADIHAYACAGSPDAPGPEVVYRLELAEATPVEAFVLDAQANRVRLGLLGALPSGAACVQSAPRLIGATLPAGTWHFVVDTTGADASAGAEYTFVVRRCHDGDPRCAGGP